MPVLALRLAASQLRQKPIARLIVVVSVACVLLINGIVFTIFGAFSRSLAEIRDARYLTVYLDGSVPAAREGELLSAVKKVSGVASAQLVSKEHFVANFSRYFPQLASEISGLEDEVIPRYVKVKARRGGDSGEGEDTAALLQRLQKLRGVEAVEMNRNRFAGLIAALGTLRRLAAALLAGMTLALLCILLNHFKLGTAFQSQVRRTLSLLGARGSHLYVPFAIEGLVEGLAAGGLAAGAFLAGGNLLETRVDGLFSAMGYHPFHLELVPVALGLVAAGMATGIIGSVWAASRSRD